MKACHKRTKVNFVQRKIRYAFGYKCVVISIVRFFLYTDIISLCCKILRNQNCKSYPRTLVKNRSYIWSLSADLISHNIMYQAMVNFKLIKPVHIYKCDKMWLNVECFKSSKVKKGNYYLEYMFEQLVITYSFKPVFSWNLSHKTSNLRSLCANDVVHVLKDTLPYVTTCFNVLLCFL